MAIGTVKVCCYMIEKEFLGGSHFLICTFLFQNLYLIDASVVWFIVVTLTRRWAWSILKLVITRCLHQTLWKSALSVTRWVRRLFVECEGKVYRWSYIQYSLDKLHTDRINCIRHSTTVWRFFSFLVIFYLIYIFIDDCIACRVFFVCAIAALLGFCLYTISDALTYIKILALGYP